MIGKKKDEGIPITEDDPSTPFFNEITGEFLGANPLKGDLVMDDESNADEQVIDRHHDKYECSDEDSDNNE